VVRQLRKQRENWRKELSKSLENDNASYKNLSSVQQTTLRDHVQKIVDVALFMLVFQHFVNPVLKAIPSSGKIPEALTILIIVINYIQSRHRQTLHRTTKPSIRIHKVSFIIECYLSIINTQYRSSANRNIHYKLRPPPADWRQSTIKISIEKEERTD
jgi:hypothetical protein